jgi:VIT1/CCC1 family predicted Fe2+/Mn2+ transporter
MYWVTGILGVFLMIAPYLFGFADNSAAYWSSILAGGIVAIASIWEGVESRKENWEYWVAAVVGIFAIIAPFIFGFGSLAGAMWTSVIAGVLIAIFAGTKLWTTSSV